MLFKNIYKYITEDVNTPKTLFCFYLYLEYNNLNKTYI